MRHSVASALAQTVKDIEIVSVGDGMPDGAREIFVLHDVEGYKHREIAELLDISAGTSKAQLHRARMILRKHLTADA